MCDSPIFSKSQEIMCKTRMDILNNEKIREIRETKEINNKQFARNGQVFIDSIDERTACASKPCIGQPV